MIKLLIILLGSLTVAFADIAECINESGQIEKVQCSTYERNKAIGALMEKITSRCANRPAIQDSESENVHSRLLDECIERKVEELSRELD